MFIATYKNGKSLREGIPNGKDEKGQDKFLTWDDIPDGLVNLQLTHPVRVHLKNPDGSIGKEVAPLITLGKFDRYYFWNEAVTVIATKGQKIQKADQGRLIAKVIAGIDDERKMVVQVRVDIIGNTEVVHYPLRDLEKRIEKGLFRGSGIRKGASGFLSKLKI